jgi:hypothetical protein
MRIWIIRDLIRIIQSFKPDNTIFESKAKTNIARLLGTKLANSFAKHV